MVIRRENQLKALLLVLALAFAFLAFSVESRTGKTRVLKSAADDSAPADDSALADDSSDADDTASSSKSKSSKPAAPAGGDDEANADAAPAGGDDGADADDTVAASTSTAIGKGSKAAADGPAAADGGGDAAADSGAAAGPTASGDISTQAASTGGGPKGTVYDITSYGAKANGVAESALSFQKAWKEACGSGGAATLLVPAGSFAAGEIILQGPCGGQMTIEIQGKLLARTDLSLFSSGNWITVNGVDGVHITGSGTVNGQGSSAWKFKTDGEGSGGSLLPISLMLSKVKNAVLDGLNFVDAKGVHVKVTDSSSITMKNLHITAPGDSPNTDGIHTSDTTTMTISDSVIATGDDCISIGGGTVGLTISGVTCGPGHGISIGSLGKRQTETDVKDITVSGCTLKGTTNGARIKTYSSAIAIAATGITFEDMTLDNVANPIIIDQNYSSKNRGKSQSKVKISDVHFRNFKGTSSTPSAIILDCSAAAPCAGIELNNIDLSPAGGASSLASECSNVKPTVAGTMNPSGCP